MRDLQDNDETLFYSLIEHYTEELLPIVYTPAVGEGCQRFSEIWRRPRGLFISYPNRHRIDQILADRRYDDVRCIVVSDGERILGLGRPGRRRHGNSYRQDGALHRIRRYSTGALPAHPARCGHRQ